MKELLFLSEAEFVKLFVIKKLKIMALLLANLLTYVKILTKDKEFT